MSTTTFFNLTSHLLNDTQRNEITIMFNNLNTFNYNDIFGTDDLPILNGGGHAPWDKYTLLKRKTISITRGSVKIPNDSNNIYNVFIFENDNYKDLFILNALREIYFQTVFRNHIINNNITEIIVPEIYRYGLINNGSNEIIFFIQIENFNFDIIPTYDDFTQLLEYYKSYKKSLNVVFNIQNDLGIYHNNLVTMDIMNRHIEKLNDVIESKNDTTTIADYNIPLIFGEHLLQLNNNMVLMNFEHSSIFQRAFNIDSYDFRFLSHIMNYIKSN